MNSIINAYRSQVALTVMGLLAAAIMLGGAAYVHAAVTNIGAVLDSSVVAPGADVEVDISATKSGSGCANNWNYSRVTVDGDTYESDHFWGVLNPATTTGSGKNSDSITFPAPNTPGNYTVVVEVVGGGEEFDSTICENGTDGLPNWGEVELDLSVEVDPSMTIVGIEEADAEKFLDDSITYTAEIEIAGVPVAGDLQCVVFDIYNDDGWQVVDVSGNDYSVPGTYFVDSPEYDLTTANGFALVESPYDVIAIALDADDLSDLGAASCDDIVFDSNSTSFTTDTYHDNDNSDDDVETFLYLIEPTVDPEVLACTLVASETVVDENEEFELTWTTDFAQLVSIDNGIGDVATSGATTTFITTDTTFTLTAEDDQDDEVICSVDVTIREDDDDDGGGSSGGGGGGKKIELTERDPDEPEDDEPTPEVLGEQISVVPVGAPNAGAGGAVPVNTIPSAVAFIGMLLSLVGIRATRNG